MGKGVKKREGENENNTNKRNSEMSFYLFCKSEMPS